MSTSRRAATAAVVLALGVLCSACGTGATAYPPTGVDELTVPSPSPDPADFVARVDNRWFPLIPGTRWVYRTPGTRGRTTAVAAAGPVVAGVATTALRTTTHASMTTASTTTDLYAQDRAGNVWWFGRTDRGTGEWRVGPGVPAGLAMAAHPRRGDGYLMAHTPSYDVRGVVVDTGRVWESRLGSSREAVVIEVVHGAVADVESFVPGIGMVQNGETGLVEFHQPRP